MLDISKLIIEMLSPKGTVLFYLTGNSSSFLHHYLVVILCVLLTLCVGHVAALDFTNSKWIWTSAAGSSSVPALATADFRQDFTAPFGKIPVSANIIIAADNNYTLYVNGEFIGRGYDFQQSQSYCVKLEPFCDNVFAVAVQNQGTTPNPAAFITAINVTYNDDTSTIIVSDASWRANSDTAGFESADFDDSTWPYAVVVGNANSAPWGVPSPPPSDSTLSLTDSYWLWNNQVPAGSPTSSAPAGTFAFRKTYKVSGGSLVQSGTIIIDADNGYTLYINGNEIGSGDNWPQAQRWTFTLDPTDEIVLAITATNTAGPAGFIVAVAFDAYYRDCSCTLVEVTDGTPDGTWKFNLGVPVGFQQPGYDDSNWPSTIVEGPYGVAPWNSVPIVNGN